MLELDIMDITQSLEMQRTKPRNLVSEDEHLFAKSTFCDFDPFSLEFFQACHVTDNGLYLRSDRFPSKLNSRQMQADLQTDGAAKVQHLNQCVFILTDTWSGNYFHWFGDVLQKLEALILKADLLAPEFLPIKIFLPTHTQTQFHLSSLRMYKDIELIVAAKSVTYKFDVATYVVGGPSTGNFLPDLLGSIKSRFVPEISNDSPSPDILFISRKLARERHVVNELKVLEMIPLAKRLELEKATLEEQIRVFNKATTIIAPHGAGLTNMLWMNRGTNVIEIRHEGDAHNNCYWAMADALGLNYFYLLGKLRLRMPRRLSPHIRRDLKVDPSKVKDVFQRPEFTSS